jgi:hypothetical protein
VTSSNQATTLESQKIRMIQQLFGQTLRKNGRKQNIMSNIAAFAFGAMMAYTLSLIVLAFVLWNTPPIYDDVADLN